MNSFESFLATLSSVVYEKRQKQKLTQVQLAKASGRSQSSIAKVESNPPSDLSLRVLFEISSGLSINLSDLILISEKSSGIKRYSKTPGKNVKVTAPLKDTSWQRMRKRLETTPPEKRKHIIKAFDEVLNAISNN